MKKKVLFVTGLLSITLASCGFNFKGKGTPSQGDDITGENRTTVTKEEWNNIFIPQNFVMNNEFDIYSEGTTRLDNKFGLYMSVNKGKVSYKMYEEDNYEFEFKYYENLSIYGYEGISGYFAEVQGGYFSASYFLKEALNLYNSYNDVNDFINEFKENNTPLVSFENAVYSEEDKTYSFSIEVPNSSDSAGTDTVYTNSYKVQFKNGVLQFLDNHTTYNKITLPHYRVFVTPDKESKKGAVTEVEWNKYFVNGEFVLDSKCMIYCQETDMAILIDHGRVELISYQPLSEHRRFPYNTSVYEFKHQTIPTFIGFDDENNPIIEEEEGIYAYIEFKYDESWESPIKTYISFTDLLCEEHFVFYWNHVLTYDKFQYSESKKQYVSLDGEYKDSSAEAIQPGSGNMTYNVSFVDGKPFMVSEQRSGLIAYFVW